jgi:hypothetical protein
MKDKMGYANEIRQLMATSQSDPVLPAAVSVSPIQRFSNRTVISVISIAAALVIAAVLITRGESTNPDPVQYIPSQSVSSQIFWNCDELKAVFPVGVALDQAAKDKKDFSNPVVNESVFLANQHLDGNGDDVMCDSK